MHSRITVSAAGDLSANQVRSEILEGREVVATPHIGNRWRSDMATPVYLGARNVVFSRNQSGKDVLDCPDLIRLDGKNIRITNIHSDPTASPYLTLDSSELVRNRIEWVLRFGNTPAQIHHMSTKALLGDESNRLDIKYMFLDDSRIVEILEKLCSIDEIELFDRYMDSSGKIHPLEQKNRTVLEKLSMLRQFMDGNAKILEMVLKGDAHSPEMPIPSNALMVLLLGIRSALSEMDRGLIQTNQEFAKVLTISGESMVKYAGAKPFLEKLSGYYSAIRMVHPSLPQELHMSFIPGANLDIVPTTAETDLQELLRNYANIWTQMNYMTTSIRSAQGTDRATLIANKDSLKNRLLQVRAEAREILGKRPFFSQYDAHHTGHSIVRMPELEAIPLKEIQPLS